MTFRPATVKCQIRKKAIVVDQVKYHTSRSEGSPAKVFCGPECSNKYYQDNGKRI